VWREVALKKGCPDVKEMQEELPTDDSEHNASDVPCTDKFCQTKQKKNKQITKLHCCNFLPLSVISNMERALWQDIVQESRCGTSFTTGEAEPGRVLPEEDDHCALQEAAVLLGHRRHPADL
jgi:hypothetical protein